MLAAMQEHTKYRPSADNALMRWIVQHAAWLIPRSEVVRHSPHSIVPWADRIVENWWSLEKQFLHIFQRSERDPEIQHQSWQTDGNPACGWEKATSRMNILSEQMMELRMREVYDDSQSTAGQKRISRESSRPHRSRGR